MNRRLSDITYIFKLVILKHLGQPLVTNKQKKKLKEKRIETDPQGPKQRYWTIGQTPRQRLLYLIHS